MSNMENIKVKDYQGNTLMPYSNIAYIRDFELEYVGEIWNNTKAGDTNVYFPSIIRTRHANALGKYYMYYSYDHLTSGANVGVKMAYSDDLVNWTKYGNVLKCSNQITGTDVQDAETPCVYWDDARGKYLMTWHSAYRANNTWWLQTTHISESSDGVNWTYVKRMCALDIDRYAGQTHDGYAKVQKINGIYTVCLLWNGGDAAKCNTGYSFNGIDWFFNATQRPEMQRYVDGLALQPAGSYPIYEINGKLYRIGPCGMTTSGAGGGSDMHIAICEVADDLLTYIGHARTLYEQAGKSGEYSTVRSVNEFVDEDGTPYVVVNYRNGSSSSDATSFVLYKLKYKL